MAFLVHTNKGICIPYNPGALGPSSEYVMIRQGVGKGGANLPDEVLALRQALNKVPPDKGGPQSTLAETRAVDDALIQAILRFKTANTPEDTSPLFQHPMRCTVSLNEILFENKQLAKTNSEILPAMISLLHEAESCIRAAAVCIDMAQDARGGVGLPGETAETRMKLLERHFKLSLMPNFDESLFYIETVFARMRQVFERPGNLWGKWVFAFDPTPPSFGWLAFARAGGFFRGGEIEGGRRQDTIYLCELLRLATRDEAVQTIVHELAHFCGPRIGETISDHGYGLPEQPKMKWLTPYQRLHNAECYGNFAFESKYGRDPAGMV